MNLYEVLRHKKIALVDDDQWILDAMGLYFKHEGCDLKTFDDANRAKEVLSQERFDIIIVDYFLKEMDGITLLNLIGEKQKGAIRLLFTGHPRSDIETPENRNAYDDFIQKPLTVRKLETSLERLLATDRSRGSGR